MGAPEPASVLVIDDDHSVRQLLETLLNAEGYFVRSAQNGFEGLAAIAHEPPDCVVLDVMMPGIDGYEVLRHIRSRSEGVGMIVVMLTAAHDDKHAWTAWSGGVDYFLAKPFEVDLLLGYLRGRLACPTSLHEGNMR
jgi:DNA-binding response OmpR family regulator